MMRTVIAIVIIVCAFVALWPVLTRLGRSALKYFGKLDKEPPNEEPASDDDSSDDLDKQ